MSRLIERAAELDLLAGELAAARAGASRAVQVTGPRGIGKTSLVEAFLAERVPAGVLVLRARCDELEREFAHGVAHQLIEPLAPSAGPAEFTEVLARVRTPVLLVVDDAHLADAASLRWLAELREHPALLRLLIRPGATAEPGSSLLTLGLLSPAGITRLVGCAEDCAEEACHQLTGGNPQLAVLLRRALTPGGDPRQLTGLAGQSFARFLQDWLCGLESPVRRLAEALSVLGETTRTALPTRLSAVDSAICAECLTELHAMGLLGSRDPVRWSHPLLREAVYHGLPQARREELHRTAAELMERSGAPAEEIAAHLLRLPPGGQDWAVRVLRAAAEQAGGRGAPEAAARYLRRALAEPPPAAQRLEVLVALGLAESAVRPAAGARHLADALWQVTDPLRQAQLAEALGDNLVRESRLEEALGVLTSAAERIRPQDPEAALLLDARRLLWAVLDEDWSRPAAAEVRRLRETVAGRTQGERSLLAALAFATALLGDSADTAAELAERALAEPEPPLTALAAAAPIWALLWAGRTGSAHGHAEAAVAQAGRAGSQFDQAIALTCRAAAASAEGDLPATIEAARAAMDLLPVETPGFPHLLPMGLLAEALLDSGQAGQAAELLACVTPSPALEASYRWLTFLVARGRVRIGLGEFESGLADLLACGERQARLGHHNPAAPQWRAWTARACLALGRTGQARELATEALELARDWGSPQAVGTALRSLGVVTGGGRGVELLQESELALRSTPARLELARTLANLGALRQSVGQHRLARQALTEAAALAEACGAADLVVAVRERLALRAEPRPATGPSALTAREKLVAELAAAGRTNADIGAQLGLTRRTVEVHLSTVYRKLGVPGRQQLREIFSP